jgi:hypothetical protein
VGSFVICFFAMLFLMKPQSALEVRENGSLENDVLLVLLAGDCHLLKFSQFSLPARRPWHGHPFLCV